MTLRFHEIAEANHRILNPFTEDKLMLVGDICRLKPEMRQLDLCCGKGEMLCQWARRWGIEGTGVDISKVFLAAAAQRAQELGVSDRITLVEADAGKYAAAANTFDIVSCIGATWIGNGLVGTLELMKRSLKPGGLLLVGEPYWIEPPPEGAVQVRNEDFASLPGTLDRIESADCDLVEMVLADGNSWDRYEAAQWWTIRDWLLQHPDDPDVEALRAFNDKGKRAYLEYDRRYLGWGVFVLREQ